MQRSWSGAQVLPCFALQLKGLGPYICSKTTASRAAGFQGAAHSMGAQWMQQQYVPGQHVMPMMPQGICRVPVLCMLFLLSRLMSALS